MKLEPHRVGGERSSRQSRPLYCTFALLGPLLARPALVVESNDALGRAAHVGHDEADAGIKFSGMPLDLGDNPPRLDPLQLSKNIRCFSNMRRLPSRHQAASPPSLSANPFQRSAAERRRDGPELVTTQRGVERGHRSQTTTARL